jgi:hypothetical protein
MFKKPTRRLLIAMGLKSFARDHRPEDVYQAFQIAKKAEDQLDQAERAEKLDYAVTLTDKLIGSLGLIFERLAYAQRGKSRFGMTTDAMNIRQRVNQIRKELRS